MEMNKSTLTIPPRPQGKHGSVPSGFIASDEPEISPTPKHERVYWDNVEKLWYRNDLSNGNADGLIDLREKLNARIFSPTRRPKEPRSPFSLAGIGICTAGNITTLAAQAKAGKSAAIGAMIAATLGIAERNFLGFNSTNPKGLALVHLDTEQSVFDHWQLIERARQRAGVSKILAWLRSHCVTGFSYQEIREAIRLTLDDAAQKFGGVHSLILDGAADAVADVNSAEESNEFVSELHALAIQYECPVICAIHLNPGSDFKTRGHLGSQLERKAETNLKIEKDDDEISTIWADKNRRKSIPKKTAPCFAWDEQAGMHVSVENPSEAKAEAKSNAKREAMMQAAGIIFARDKSPRAHKEIVRLLCDKFQLQTSGARRRLETWFDSGVVTKNESGFYTLNQ
jgi:AAA domain